MREVDKEIENTLGARLSLDHRMLGYACEALHNANKEAKRNPIIINKEKIEFVFEFRIFAI